MKVSEIKLNRGLFFHVYMNALPNMKNVMISIERYEIDKYFTSLNSFEVLNIMFTDYDKYVHRFCVHNLAQV